MFTGIVSGLGVVDSVRRVGTGARISVREAGAASEAEIGDSVAVNGVCLTVTSIESDRMSFDLSGETLKSTTLGDLRAGDKVNIEQSLRAGGKLGGHFVTGHVDAVGKIRSRRKEGQTFRFEVQAPPEVMELLVEKGSVAVDGISLTVVEVMDDSFTIVIIPHTAEVTTLSFKADGDAVNLEADMIGKYVRKLMAGRSAREGGLMDALKREGFTGQG